MQFCSDLKQLALGLVSFSKKVRGSLFECMYSIKACSHPDLVVSNSKHSSFVCHEKKCIQQET